MLYKLRTGDIVLCENKSLNTTNAYLIVYDNQYGFGLWCLGCGEGVGFYGNNIEKFKKDLLDKKFLNIQQIIPKEYITDFFNKNYKLNFPIKTHDGFNDLDIIIDL